MYQGLGEHGVARMAENGCTYDGERCGCEECLNGDGTRAELSRKRFGRLCITSQHVTCIMGFCTRGKQFAWGMEGGGRCGAAGCCRCTFKWG